MYKNYVNKVFLISCIGLDTIKSLKFEAQIIWYLDLLSYFLSLKVTVLISKSSLSQRRDTWMSNTISEPTNYRKTQRWW